MKIEKVLEILFVDIFNTTAIILETKVVVKLFNGAYMCRKECFDFIHKNYGGWVQTSKNYREYKNRSENTAIAHDPLLAYEELYDELEKYASEKFKKEFKRNSATTNSPQSKDTMPFSDILKTIELIRDSFVGSEIVYTEGSCVKLAMILKHIYPAGKILYNEIECHAIFEYDGRYFDINGFANPNKGYEPIEKLDILTVYTLMNNKFQYRLT